MDAYSPSHPTDQDMEVESDSAPTPEQDAHQNHVIPADISGTVVPLIFSEGVNQDFSDGLASLGCPPEPNTANPGLNSLQSTKEATEPKLSESPSCATPVREAEPKPVEEVIRNSRSKESSKVERVDVPRRRSRSRSHKRNRSRSDDRRNRRKSRSHSRGHYPHSRRRSRSHSRDRRRRRSITPERRQSRVGNYRSRPRSRSGSRQRTGRSVTNDRHSGRKQSEQPIAPVDTRPQEKAAAELVDQPEVIPWDPTKMVSSSSEAPQERPHSPQNLSLDSTQNNLPPGAAVDLMLPARPRVNLPPPSRWNYPTFPTTPMMPNATGSFNANARYPQSPFGVLNAPQSNFPPVGLPFPTSAMPPYLQPPVMIPRIPSVIPMTMSSFGVQNTVQSQLSTLAAGSNFPSMAQPTTEAVNTTTENSPMKQINKLLSSAANSLLNQLAGSQRGVLDVSTPEPLPPPPPPPLPSDNFGNQSAFTEQSFTSTFVPPPLPVVSTALDEHNSLPVLANGENQPTKPHTNPFEGQKMEDVLAKRKRYDFASRREWQERIALEVKSVLKPAYAVRRINKEDYKEIMKKAVTKILRSGTSSVNSEKINVFVKLYIEKYHRMRKLKSRVASKETVQ
ncbi:PHD and RING finger domain-containing protein 1 [Clonorchis sinensis]|uniref:PHD and RING finger domain-containing protein 1 n=1 Tax=Clonorchis sinensis TaxID=79923 RepID=H2KSX0_CLOSI|nr:PHD and RING finger domain-containing protein 1 [Clonorchis sinensis]